MEDDRLRLFVNIPLRFNDIPVYSPTIKEIATIGETLYSIYLLFATFDAKRILGEEQISSLDGISQYKILLSLPDVVDMICQSLTFFLKEPVYYNVEGFFCLGEFGRFLDESNYLDFVRIIKLQNCIPDLVEQKPKYRGSKAKELLEIRDKYEKMTKKRNSLDLKDILSILCYASGNGISVLNCENLTIYHVYEQWERMNLHEGHSRMHPVWANGLLDDPKKLQEWMVKTKL